VPDATGLELIAQELREAHPDSVLDTTFHRGRAEIRIEPAMNRDVLSWLQNRGYTFLTSLHGVDYYPEEPRLGVCYELLDMKEVDRISIKARVTVENPGIPSVVGLWPGADFQERECFDMFGVVFDGHPDLRRILMPEDYEGFPQRRDFPVGGEPILFTFNEEQSYGKWQ
jgi:NADH-quinone oxidoreductase subunit C